MRKSRMGRMRLHAAFGHCAKPCQKNWDYGLNTTYFNRIEAIHIHYMSSIFLDAEWSINSGVGTGKIKPRQHCVSDVIEEWLAQARPHDQIQQY